MGEPPCEFVGRRIALKLHDRSTLMVEPPCEFVSRRSALKLQNTKEAHGSSRSAKPRCICKRKEEKV